MTTEDRNILGAAEAADRLRFGRIDYVEFVEGETEDEDYLVLRVGDLTLYASKPTVYGPKS